MDQHILNLLIGVIMTLFGIVGSGVTWWVSTIWSMVRTQQEQITRLSLELARNYTPKHELHDMLNQLLRKIDEIQVDIKEIHKDRGHK